MQLLSAIGATAAPKETVKQTANMTGKEIKEVKEAQVLELLAL